MNPQEKQNLGGNKSPEKVETKEESPLNLKEGLKKVFQTSSLKQETINNLTSIINYTEISKLEDFIISNPDLEDFINGKGPLPENINDIAEDFIKIYENVKNDKSEQMKNTGGLDEKKLQNTTNDVAKTQIKEGSEKIKGSVEKAQETINKNIDTYRKVFADNKDFLRLLDDSVINYEIALKNPHDTKHQESINAIADFLKTPENRKAIFDKLAATKDATLYRETYQALSDLSPTIAGYLKQTVTPEIYEIPPSPEPIPKPIVAQFPGAKPEDIEKRGDLVSYNGKTIDLKTGKAYISGEGGYAIETSMKVPNSLDLRVKYQKERLEILDEIKTEELFQKNAKNTLKYIKEDKIFERKNDLERDINEKRSLKKSDKKDANELQLDSKITELESELQLINARIAEIKQAFPKQSHQSEEEYLNNIEKFLEGELMKSEEKVEELKTQLETKKTQFDADMQKLLEAGQDEIRARDKNVKETISFLDDLGITNINQHDLQKIINRININPQAYNFSKPIDLRKLLEGENKDVIKQKREFFNFFAKMYEKMGLTNPPVSESVINGVHKDARLKNDSTFKQNMEDAGVTLGGALQIETFFTLIKEEPKKEQTQKQEK